MLKYIADITILAVEIICYLIFFGIFARGKKIKVKQKISAICLLISIVYVCVHFLKNYTIVKLLMIMLTMLIVIRFLYEISAVKTIILTLLIQGIIGVIDYIVIMIVTARYNNIDILEDSTDLIGVLVIIASRIILFLFLIIIKRISVIKKKNVIDMSNKEWLQFLIFPIFTLITVIVMTNSMVTSYHEDIVNVYYVIAIVLIVLNMVVFHLINEILENSQRIREADVLKQQSIGQLELYNSLRKNYDIQRKRTHEYKNQIMCIDSLLKKKNYNKLEEYINSIFDKLDGQLDMVDTNNEVVNAVINAKYYEALQNDVLFILKINDLSHIKVSDEDIVTILSNLLDNAIEAAGQCDIDKRTVGIKLLYEDDVLSIAVSNSYKTEPEIMEDGYMRTIKDDKEQHGLGIRNVVATLEKYNAEYIIDYKNGEFVFSIIM
jgi:two-component system sensor histidine kinase AgrC